MPAKINVVSQDSKLAAVLSSIIATRLSLHNFINTRCKAVSVPAMSRNGQIVQFSKAYLDRVCDPDLEVQPNDEPPILRPSWWITNTTQVSIDKFNETINDLKEMPIVVDCFSDTAPEYEKTVNDFSTTKVIVVTDEEQLSCILNIVIANALLESGFTNCMTKLITFEAVVKVEGEWDRVNNVAFEFNKNVLNNRTFTRSPPALKDLKFASTSKEYLDTCIKEASGIVMRHIVISGLPDTSIDYEKSVSDFLSREG